MSLLSDISIMKALEEHRIDITPFNQDMLRPASVDLTLGDSWQGPKANEYFNYVDAVKRNAHYEKAIATMVTLDPGAFVLGTTKEIVSLDNTIAAKFEGKSSLGRMGIMTHITAGFIDPGFSGHITLEIFNASPWKISLAEGMKIGQIIFTNLDVPASEGYGAAKWGSHYQNQRGATGVLK